ncbi:MAG: hypothetical protein QXX87_00700 [Candidatus Jordarchaeales archaeon]
MLQLQLPGTLVFTAIWAAAVVAVIVFNAVIAVRVYRDARGRGASAAFWFLVVLLAGIIGLTVYFVVNEK